MKTIRSMAMLMGAGLVAHWHPPRQRSPAAPMPKKILC